MLALKFTQGQQKTTTHMSQTWSRAHTFQNHFKLLIQCGDCDKFCPLLGTLLTSRPLLPLRFVIPGVLSSSELSKSPLGTFTCWQIGLPRVQWLYLEPVWGPAIFTGMPQSPVANADPCRVCVYSSDELARYQTISLLHNTRWKVKKIGFYHCHCCTGLFLWRYLQKYKKNQLLLCLIFLH